MVTAPSDVDLAVVRASGLGCIVVHRTAESRLEAFSVDPEASYRIYEIDLRGLRSAAAGEAVRSASRPVVDAVRTQLWLWDAVRRWVALLGYPQLRAAGPLLVAAGPPAGSEVELTPASADLSVTVGWNEGAAQRAITVQWNPGLGGWERVTPAAGE